jgi:hypothetical protein
MVVQLPPLREEDRYPSLRVRVFSPLGHYPRHPIAIPGARLVVSDELIMSAVHVDRPEAHGLEYYFELEFLALEEKRFLAGIALAAHPDNGMAYTYPLHGHVDVDFELDDDAVIEAAQQLAARPSEHYWRTRGVPPPACGGPTYLWREAGVNVDKVLNVVSATPLNDHLLMRGLGALLQADMCSQHREIEGVALLPLYVALEVSFQIVLRLLREQGVSDPTVAVVDQFESRRLDLRRDERFVRTMQSLDDAGARAGLGRVIAHDQFAARLQRLIRKPYSSWHDRHQNK